MNDNLQTQRIPPLPQHTMKTRKVLGRGLKEILADQSITEMNDLPEHVKASHIGSKILELIDLVDSKYQSVIFKSVTAYQTVSQMESTEVISQQLNELENIRIRREKEILKPKKKWYFLYLR